MNININWNDPAVTSALDVLKAPNTNFNTYYPIFTQLVRMGFPIDNELSGLLQSAQNDSVIWLLSLVSPPRRRKHTRQRLSEYNKRQRR